jgi:beta-glucanase (GH16 family)
VVAVRATRAGLLALLALACSSFGAGAFMSPRSDPAAGASDRSPHLVWLDRFQGRAGQPPDSSKWRYDVGGGGWGNHELERYTRRAANARLDGRGHLVVIAHSGNHAGPSGGRRYTSARLKTLGRFSFRYGRVAARMRVPAGRGLWPAFWMLGANIGRVGYPRCGEIDVMEVLGQDPRTVYGTVHGPGPDLDRGIGGKLTAPRSLARGFHVYAASWTPNRVRFSLDGKTYETVRRSTYPRRDVWALDHRMFILLNLAVGGWPGPPNRATHFPGRLKVDWVRVWQDAAGQRKVT